MCTSSCLGSLFFPSLTGRNPCKRIDNGPLSKHKGNGNDSHNIIPVMLMVFEDHNSIGSRNLIVDTCMFRSEDCSLETEVQDSFLLQLTDFENKLET